MNFVHLVYDCLSVVVRGVRVVVIDASLRTVTFLSRWYFPSHTTPSHDCFLLFPLSRADFFFASSRFSDISSSMTLLHINHLSLGLSTIVMGREFF